MQLKFYQLGAQQGLPQSHITCIAQDHSGFLWLGTYDGLYRYDGYSFKSFNHDPLNKNSIDNSWIQCLLVDHRGLIWFGTQNGLNCYDPQTGKLKKFLHRENDPASVCAEVINCLAEDDRGNIWVGTQAGLSVLDSSRHKFISFFHDEKKSSSLSNDNVTCIFQDRESRLWIGTSDGLNLFQPTSRTFSLFRNSEPAQNDPGSANGSVDNITCIMQTRDGSLWLGTWSHGLQLFKPELKSFKTFWIRGKYSRSVAGNVVNTLCEDHDGRIWVGTYDGGLILFRRETETFLNYHSDASSSEALSGDHIMSLYEDRNHLLWIATNGGGLNYASLAPEKFSVIKNYDEDIKTHFPLHVMEDHEGKIWLSTFGGGIKCCDPATWEVKSYEFDRTDLIYASCNWAQCAIEDREKNIWFGCLGGIAMLKKKTGDVEYYRLPVNANQSVIIHSIVEGDGDTLWSATTSGFKIFSKKSGKFFDVKQSDVSAANIEELLFLCQDHAGQLLIAGSSLYAYDPVLGRMKVFPFHNQQGVKQKLLINGINEDHFHRIWVGTNSNGLICLESDRKTIHQFTTTNGLASNSVAGVVEDHAHHLWVSTSQGISEIEADDSLKHVQFRNYDISDGVAGNDNTYYTLLSARNGMIYFGTQDGLFYFHPDSLKDNSFIPPVAITDFQLFNKSMVSSDTSSSLKQPIEFAKEIKLSYRQNVFSFGFAALNFLHPEKNQYAYQLAGFDKDWIYTDASHRTAAYTNLDAGTYFFKVKGSNNDGVWNETSTDIKLIITPPYWQTWWFKLLVGAALAAALYGIYYSRLQKMRDIRRIRNKIASDLHDDLGATLSSISIMSEIANQQIKNQSPQTSPLLEKIGSSSRSMIENVNDMVWAINPKNDSFENIFKRMRTFASEILGAKDINFNFDFDKNLLQSKMKMDARRNFYLIFKEAVNNIAKYSEAANAFIIILQKETFLKMTVRDDGKGFDIATIKRGNGLNNMQHRADEMKAKLLLQSDLGKGTMVQLEFRNAG